MNEPVVGIIANPASGKDIRRLVAHGSAFDNNEKINIVRRLLLGIDATGVGRVAAMPDLYGIVERAAATLSLRLRLEPLPMAMVGAAGDSTEAAQRLAALGAACIVTLGGDGTNRAVAKGCGDVPLVAISTGTNNVFPRMVEGTVAGLAAGFVSVRSPPRDEAGDRIIRRMPRLEIWHDDRLADIALVDVVTSAQPWIGSRAVWRAADLREVVLARLAAAEIGIASLGGLLFPETCGGCSGAYVRIDETRPARRLLAPIAPGLLEPVAVADARLLAPGERASLDGAPCTVALDGERELRIPPPGAPLAVRLEPRGPRVVDVPAALAAAARLRLFDLPVDATP